MQAIILAAGRGSRLGTLTEDRPKTLVHLNGRPMLSYVLDSLPDEITEIIMIVGYKGELIKEYLGDSFNGRKIQYVVQNELNGTAHALWQARPLIKGRFLVSQGDDIHTKESRLECLRYPLSYAICRRALPYNKQQTAIVSSEGYITGLKQATESECAQGINITAGMYVLDERIFDEQPVAWSNAEFGLPQTIMQMAQKIPVQAVYIHDWISVNTPEDLAKAENIILK